MAVNLYKFHLLILPEDDANRQLALGLTNHPRVFSRLVDLRPPAGGWSNVRATLRERLVGHLERYPAGCALLLIDFDNVYQQRMELFRRDIPESVADRVFILGTLSEPERLKAALGGSLEAIGTRLVDGCGELPGADWSHELVAVNAGERDRFRNTVCTRLMSAR